MKRGIFILVLTFLGSLLLAQDTLQADSTFQIDEVVVTYDAGKNTPITFLNIGAKEIQLKSVGQEPSFLLAETPSITNYSDAGSGQGYSYLRLRGIDQTRINITLDGVPLNEPEDQGAYFSNFPDLFNSVSKIQIQRGVGTSKNGTASYAGNIELFSPNLNDSSKITFGAGYGSFNSMRVFGEFKSGIKYKKALYIRASQVYSQGYKYHSSNNSQSVFISGGLFYKKSSWKINLLAGNQMNQLAWLGVSDSLIAIDRKTNLNDNERDRFTQCLGQLQNVWYINTSSSVQSSIYYAFQNGNYDFNLNSFLGLPSTEELFNYAFQSHLAGFFSNYRFTKKQWNWTTGIHANIYNRRHLGSEQAAGKLYENKGFKNEISIFSKGDYTYKWFTLFADVQYRYTIFNYKGAVRLEGLSWNFINPKAGLSARIMPKLVLYYSIGKTGREPTRNDLFAGNDDLLADSLGNPILGITSPEHVLDHELGLRYQSPKWYVGFNLYYMDFRNEIVLAGNFGPNGLALTNNVDQSYRTGAELSVNYKVNKYFNLTNHSSFNYSRIKEQGQLFSPVLSPLFIINQEASYTFKGFSIAIALRYQDLSYINFANTATVEAYYTLNSRIGYLFKGIELDLFVNNLTNTKYYNNGYTDFDGTNKYFVQAPITFYASIKYSF